MSSLVSIIVPYYNTSLNIYKKCQQSLLLQTYSNIEIVVVDDGSKKYYSDALDTITALDTRIRVIHKQNGGVSSARNLALEHCKGKYIAFVDSDDWVEPEFIEILVTTLERNDAQIATVDLVYEYNGTETLVNNTITKTMLLSQSEYYVAILCSTGIHGYLCNKLFLKELVTHPLNEKYHYCEDFVFNAHYLANVRVGVASSARLYHYRQGNSNASSNFMYNKKILTLIDAYKEGEQLYRQMQPLCIYRIRLSILKQALNIRARYKISAINAPLEYAYLQQTITEYWDVYDYSTLPVKLNLLLTKLFPVLLFKLKRIVLSTRNK